MNYTLLIYVKPEDFAVRQKPEELPAYRAAWMQYIEMLQAAGVFVTGSGLEPPETASTLILNGEDRHVQDGPYAETKEQLGGFFIIDVPNLDAALEWAWKMPVGHGRIVEVRPNLPRG